MVQNHLLQILCLIAIEPPTRLDAAEIRNKKVDVLGAIRPLGPSEVTRAAVRGQFGQGEVDGQRVPAYGRSPARRRSPPPKHLPVGMLFSYGRTFRAPAPDAYETRLLDVMRGDATLFMRDDQVEAAWEIVMPILDAWRGAPEPE